MGIKMKNKLHYILGSELIELPALAGCRVLSGEESLQNWILSANIMEVPDIQNWAQKGDLLVTTGYAFKDQPEKLITLAKQLVEKGVAALAIKPRRFIEEIPEELIETARKAGLLLIELGSDAVFSNIMYETVQAISYKGISDFLAAQKQIDRILSRLNLEDSQEKMLMIVEEELGRELLLVDSEGHILSGKGIVLTDEVEKKDAQITFQQKTFCLAKEFLTDREKTILLYTDSSRPAFSAETERALDSIFPILQFQMKNNNLMQQKAMEYKNRFLVNLLQGVIMDTTDIFLFAEEYGIPFNCSRKYLVGVFAYDTDGRGQQIHAKLKHYFKGWSQKYILCLDNGMLTIILEETERPEVMLKELLPEMEKALNQRVQVALSSPEPLNLITVAYREALKIHRVSRKCHIRGHILRNEDLGIFSLLSLIPNQAEAMEYAVKIVGKLYQYDADNDGNLADTLEKYLENGCNAKQTGKLLFIHYNTMLYRLEKIQQILQMDMENADNRLQLQIALKLYAMQPGTEED